MRNEDIFKGCATWNMIILFVLFGKFSRIISVHRAVTVCDIDRLSDEDEESQDNEGFGVSSGRSIYENTRKGADHSGTRGTEKLQVTKLHVDEERERIAGQPKATDVQQYRSGSRSSTASSENTSSVGNFLGQRREAIQVTHTRDHCTTKSSDPKPQESKKAAESYEKAVQREEAERFPEEVGPPKSFSETSIAKKEICKQPDEQVNSKSAWQTSTAPNNGQEGSEEPGRADNNDGWDDDWDFDEPPVTATSGSGTQACNNSEQQVNYAFVKCYIFLTTVLLLLHLPSEGLTNISSVVEAGLGLPSPEELAKSDAHEKPANDAAAVESFLLNLFHFQKTEETGVGISSYGKLFAGFGTNVVAGSLDVLEALGKKTFEKLTVSEESFFLLNLFQFQKNEETGVGISSYGKLFAGFGTNVVAGSLDVLEALGKKTFEKLTVSEEGTSKRRFIFEPERGQNLSEVLRELRESHTDQPEPENNSCVTKRGLTFVDFFEKSGGLTHLEGLEMLSKNHLRKIPSHRRREVDEVFEEELANTLEDYQDEEKHFVEKFEEILKAMALPYNGSSLLDCDRRCQERLQRLPDSGEQSFEFFLGISSFFA
ncbi:unnamed protein product [Gongylonema pulchrum]|uniref:FH2 domain-containing protein n=1 Tax=Gongylonema pulchrum TaxID=637853 RepID=A0A183DV80_9BILA|nr:unnamed protein product [Gongylonema pulchrum]